jgi:CRISPR/Cas system-associated endonuclease Cas3-HD
MKNKVDKLIKNADTLLIITDKGVGIQGKKGDVIGALGVLLHHMRYEMDVPEDVLKDCLELALKPELDNVLEDDLDKCLDEAKALMDKLPSDDKDKKNLDKILKHMEEINKMIKEI